MPDRPKGMIPAIVDFFLGSNLSVILVVASLILGASAIMLTPREEEPQIVVPMADVYVEVPGAGAEEVEKLVTTPLERMLWQIHGVEYVYSVSRRNQAMVTVRFYVGEDRERSLIKLYNQINKNKDKIPPIVSNWVVKPVEIDDVPIVSLVLHSDRHSDHDLRRIAEELFHRLAEVEDVSDVSLTSGRRREVRVELDPERTAGYGLSPLGIARILEGADRSATAGRLTDANTETLVVSDSFVGSAKEAMDLVVGVSGGKPVYLRDVAKVIDGPEEPGSYSRIGFGNLYLSEIGRAEDQGRSFPAVTIAVAKKRGANAVNVSKDVIERLERIKNSVLPEGVSVTVARDYGATAQAKVSDLIGSLGFAIITVVALLAFTLGWREGLIVALAVPISFSLALFVNYMLGFTINRVTLFALILSLGLVVDDPITNVDNIQRHILMGKRPPRQATLFAVAEVLPPVIMSTLAIIVSFTPLFFITGMMGPYMAPMAANVPLTVTFSTLLALTIVPWMAFKLLRKVGRHPGKAGDGEGVPGWIMALYKSVAGPFLDSRAMRWGLLGAILVLLAGTLALPALGLVPLKMLPFDNKNELQLVIDLPEGSTLERTDRAARDFEAFLRTVPEVANFTTYAGEPSPMDFNGMVRHYYWRGASNLADIRVNLADKDRREMQSHAMALRLRPELTAIAQKHGAVLRIVETPPGPPVISTLTTEVYGPLAAPYSLLLRGAEHVRKAMAAEPFVVDVDDSSETPREVIDFVLDKEKAALHGVSARDVTESLALALSGVVPARVHEPDERFALPIRIIWPLDERSSPARLAKLQVATSDGKLVPLIELGRIERVPVDQPIYHKNLKRVAYVYAEMAGRSPAEAVLSLQAEMRDNPPPAGVRLDWAGEGEWNITLDVFRDLGIAFGAAMVGIYILLIVQTNSFFMPLLIMTAIPLTLLGILPGFWLLNLITGQAVGIYPDPVFFTATSMIGMIALGGIVIRNSVVLIDFIQGAVKQGLALKEAIVKSGAIRLRPIVLTALTTALGAWPITLDPIFSGLAWALIFGLFASTLFTLLVIPIAYYALYRTP